MGEAISEAGAGGTLGVCLESAISTGAAISPGPLGDKGTPLSVPTGLAKVPLSASVYGPVLAIGPK